MTTVDPSFDALLARANRGDVGTDEALALFDTLPAVRPEEMLGEWRGEEFPTGHPMDGLLAATGWAGKRFDDADRVHPLLFWDATRTSTFADVVRTTLPNRNGVFSRASSGTASTRAILMSRGRRRGSGATTARCARASRRAPRPPHAPPPPA